MADILMYTDLAIFNRNMQTKINGVKLDKLTTILAAYAAMDIGEITGPEFISLVQNPAAFVFDKMTNGQDVVIGGLKVNKTKALEILEKPAGYNAMYDLITAYHQTVPNWNHYLSMVDIDVNEVIIAQSIIDAETEAAKVYAKTDKEKKLLEFGQALIALVAEKFGEKKPDLEMLVNDVVRRQSTHGMNDYQYSINAYGIKGHSRNDI